MIWCTVKMTANDMARTKHKADRMLIVRVLNLVKVGLKTGPFILASPSHVVALCLSVSVSACLRVPVGPLLSILRCFDEYLNLNQKQRSKIEPKTFFPHSHL